MSNPLSQYIPLLELAKQLPQRPHLATLYRWATRGIRGVKLKTYKVGRVRCTTREDAERFFVDAANGTAMDERDIERSHKPGVQRALTELDERGV